MRIAASDSTDDLIAWAQRFKSLGDVQWASFYHKGTPIFTMWIEPRAGQPVSTLIQAYFQRGKKWYLFLDEAAAAKNISVLIAPEDDKLVFFTSGQREFLSHSLVDLKLPRGVSPP